MDIFKDLGIGVPSGLKPTEKANLVNIVNSAVGNNDVIKTNMINAINSKLGTSLTVDKGWADIQSAIGGYVLPTVESLGAKRMAKGVTMSTTVNSKACVDISNLAFKPSVVIARHTGNSVSNQGFSIYVERNTTYLYSCYTNIGSNVWSGSSAPSTLYFVSKANGFTIEVYTNNYNYEWIAFE